MIKYSVFLMSLLMLIGCSSDQEAVNIITPEVGSIYEAPGDILFQTDFEDQDLTGWAINDNPGVFWSVRDDNGNKVLGTTFVEQSWSASWVEVGDYAWTDIDVECQMKITQACTDDVGISIRTGSAWPTEYKLRIHHNQIRLQKRTPPERPFLLDVPRNPVGIPGQWFPVRFRIVGYYMEAWVDGVKYVDMEDTDLTAAKIPAGRVSFHSDLQQEGSGADFFVDDVIVREAGSGVD